MALRDSNKPLSSASPGGGREGEINTLPSMTIPDMCISVKELYQRYRLGTLPAEFVRSVLYDECDDFDSVLGNYLPQYDLVDCDQELSKLRQKFELMHATSFRPASPATPVAGEADDVGEKAE